MPDDHSWLADATAPTGAAGPDHLKGVLSRVPADLPTVPWAAPEEIRRLGRSRQRRRMVSATFAGVVAISLGAAVAFQPNWLPTADGYPGDGSVVAVGSAPATTPAFEPLPIRSPVPGRSEPGNVATVPALPPEALPGGTTPGGQIPADVMLAPAELPGRYALVGTMGGTPPSTPPTSSGPRARTADWLFAETICREPAKAPPDRPRQGLLVHMFRDGRTQADQTVESYPDPGAAEVVMSGIRAIIARGCGLPAVLANRAAGFAGDDSLRFLHTVKGGGDGTYWTVVRTGNMVATLRVSEAVIGGAGEGLNPVARMMAKKLCAAATTC